MKNRNLALNLIGACLCLVSTAVTAQTTIMPFGDSVTANGSAPESSYRYWLYKYLVNGGYNVDFIGNQSGVADGAPANSDFDQDYQGGDGWTSADAVTSTENSAASQSPDIVLLDFGANDVLDGIPASTVRVNLEQIIEDFRAVNPNVRILLAQPTPWVTTDRNERRAMSNLKFAVKNAAKNEKRKGARVTVVNLSSSFNAKTDTKDGTHPNIRGEQKIAKRYYSALKGMLRRN